MEYTIYQLADDLAAYGPDSGKFIVTTSDQQHELSGPMSQKDAARFAGSLNALQKTLTEIDFEIEQRRHGGNDEDWIDLKKLSDEGHAVLAMEGEPA